MGTDTARRETLYEERAALSNNVRIGDIIKGLPVAPGQCAGVYASHVLEHLAFDGFHTALEYEAVAEAGGIFRLVVPDLEWAGS